MSPYPRRRSSALLVLVVTAFVASGCVGGLAGSVQVPERRMTTFDFSPYLERGFVFTPALYEGPYETRGFIALAYRPSTADAVRRLAEGRPESAWAADGQGGALLQRMHEAAQRLGADAVMQLSVETTTDNTGLVTYHLSGYAIKRGAEATGSRIEEVPIERVPPEAEEHSEESGGERE